MKQIFTDSNAIADSWLPDINTETINQLIHNQAVLIRNEREKTVYSIRDGRGGNPFILKIWTYLDLRHLVKDSLRIGNPYSEYAGLRLLNDSDIACPKLLYFGKDEPNFFGRTYYQITEYIEPGMDALEYVKYLLSHQRERDANVFSDKLIAITNALLKIRLVDIDHKMINLMVDRKGSPVKIDLELLRIMPRYLNCDKQIGKMVGSFLYTYAFAVQPNNEMAQKFADQMFNSLIISQNAKKVAAKVVQNALSSQCKNTGIYTEIEFGHLIK